MSKPFPHPLHLFNSLTRRRQNFVPRAADRVKMFTCGPSIYGRPHIGNYRTFIYEDILYRYLDYLGYRVDRLINFTDVEDKAISKAKKQMSSLRELTERAAESFFKTCGLLHIKVPDYIPRSSTSVGQAVHLIQQLLKKGIAYRHGRDIFYDPLKFHGFGKLYGLDMDAWPEKKRRFRKDTYQGNRWNRGDFILWHGHMPERDGDVYWETALGRGRPAWNVQDPAMISKHLGYEIDICCGGVDNLFRHHDYNIAVIEGVSGMLFSPYWLHGEHVFLNGKKMSKSKGNIVYPEELLDKGISAAGLRLYLIRGHYRKKLNLTEKLLIENDNYCRKLQELARQFTGPLGTAGKDNVTGDKLIGQLEDGFTKGMNDDLHVDRAIGNVLTALEKMAAYKTEYGFGERQWQKIRMQLLRIEGVLQVLYV